MMGDNLGKKIHWDNLGRLWIVCPKCGRKTPAWTSTSGMIYRQNICRWCGAKWHIENLPPSYKGVFYAWERDLLKLEEVRIKEGWDS